MARYEIPDPDLLYELEGGLSLYMSKSSSMGGEFFSIYFLGELSSVLNDRRVNCPGCKAMTCRSPALLLK